MAQTCPQNLGSCSQGSLEMDLTWKEETREAKNNLEENLDLLKR